VLVHDAEENWSADVFGAQWSWDQGGEDVQSGGFAATSFGGKEVEPGCKVKGTDRVGMAAPESKSVGSAKRQHEVSGIAGGDLVKEFRAIDGFGPGFDSGELDGIGLGFNGKLGSVYRDFCVEGLDSEVEAASFSAANAVVLGAGEPGEALEGFLIEVGGSPGVD